MHIPVQKQRHVPVHVPVERPIEVPMDSSCDARSYLCLVFFGKNAPVYKPIKKHALKVLIPMGIFVIFLLISRESYPPKATPPSNKGLIAGLIMEANG